LAPIVTTPDTALTSSIRQSTGTNPATSAFQTRSLRTSARLQDGQSLLIGGLLSRNTNDTQAGTPGVRDIPGLGWLFKNLNRTDDALELVI
jgi:type II secretory pathway component GspD/PulD (secretin)